MLKIQSNQKIWKHFENSLNIFENLQNISRFVLKNVFQHFEKCFIFVQLFAPAAPAELNAFLLRQLLLGHATEVELVGKSLGDVELSLVCQCVLESPATTSTGFASGESSRISRKNVVFDKFLLYIRFQNN